MTEIVPAVRDFNPPEGCRKSQFTPAARRMVIFSMASGVTGRLPRTGTAASCATSIPYNVAPCQTYFDMSVPSATSGFPTARLSEAPSGPQQRLGYTPASDSH